MDGLNHFAMVFGGRWYFNDFLNCFLLHVSNFGITIECVSPVCVCVRVFVPWHVSQKIETCGFDGGIGFPIYTK